MERKWPPTWAKLAVLHSTRHVSIIGMLHMLHMLLFFRLHTSKHVEFGCLDQNGAGLAFQHGEAKQANISLEYVNGLA
eukprot:scaffold9255_cov33-Prasinocladus_malaysianus.AAC.1